MIFTPLSSWDRPLEKPVLVAGPCSAESEEQVLRTAEELSKIKVDIYRSGVWKPRTRPGAFEGVGEIALKWLQHVQKEFNLPVAVEVANANHVEACQRHDINILWLGARTTVNPFAVDQSGYQSLDRSNRENFQCRYQAYYCSA